MADTVILYTQESCVNCQAEKQWLNLHNIEYQERDIRKNPKYMEEARKLGASATPVTVIKKNEEEEVIMGYDQERLALLLNI